VTKSRVVLFASVTLAVLLLTACSSAPAKSETHHSAVNTPSPSISPDPPLTIESVQIPTGLTPDQLGAALVDRISKWDRAGATEANRAKFLKIISDGSGNDGQPFCKELSLQNQAIYGPALFGPNWQSSVYVQNKPQSNALDMLLYFKTVSLGRVPYEHLTMLDTAYPITSVQNPDGSITEHISYVESDNAAANGAVQLEADGQMQVNGDKGVIIATFVPTNGAEIISDWNIVRH
jgi:hypothetical protein